MKLQSTLMQQTMMLTFVFCSTDQGEEPATEPIRVQEAALRNKRSRHTCDICDKVIIGDLEWTGRMSNFFFFLHVYTYTYLSPTHQPLLTETT